MDLVYLAGSLAGVGLMVGLSFLLFGVRASAFANLSDAVHRLAEEIAGFHAGETASDSANRAALIENARDGAIHLVVARGDGLAIRRLRKDSLKRVARAGATLDLQISDLTLPR